MQFVGSVQSNRVLAGRCLAPSRPQLSRKHDRVHLETSGSSRRRPVASGNSYTAAGLKDAAAPLANRVMTIYEKKELDAALERAGDRLVVLELMKDAECETGLFEVSEDQWSSPEEQHEARMQECTQIRSMYMDLAATSLAARFYCVMEDSEALSDIPPALGITMFPAVVFFKNKKIVWLKQGSHGMKGDLAEGVLAMGGKQYVTNASVAELVSEQDFDAFVKAKTANEQHLKIVMMSSYMCSPCVHAYPYFVALSASFTDFEFARLEGDDEDMGPVFERLNILEVPTLLVYDQDAREVARLVSSDPGDLVGFIIDLSAKLGFRLPPKAGR